ncbi:DUF5988 family protein [Streptomyces sp. NPDC052051]|uniref:DUF5988 family protein n=1 Tax=Streptomyces sp. NPDC052051 TaxID=3154649 RepID=UPI003433B203
MKQTPNVILQGSGPSIPDEERVRYLPDTTDTFKLFLGNRYEHYRSTDSRHAHDCGRDLRVFEWVRSTYVAE